MSDADQIDVRDIVGGSDFGDSRIVCRRNLIECVARLDCILHSRRWRGSDGRAWDDQYLTDADEIVVGDVIGSCNFGDGRFVQRRNLIERVTGLDRIFYGRRWGWCDACSWDDEHLPDTDQVIVCNFVSGSERSNCDVVSPGDAVKCVT